jgi:hypothetical protein
MRGVLSMISIEMKPETPVGGWLVPTITRCATLFLKPLIYCGVGILPAQSGRARRPSHKTFKSSCTSRHNILLGQTIASTRGGSSFKSRWRVSKPFQPISKTVWRASKTLQRGLNTLQRGLNPRRSGSKAIASHPYLLATASAHSCTYPQQRARAELA